MATARNHSISISARGSAVDERKSAANISGKRPCTASPLPARSAANAPSPPKASDIKITSTTIATAPGSPVSKCAPAAKPTVRNTARLDQAEHHDTGELADEQRAPAQRSEREPAEEPGLHVVRDVRAGAHRAEQPALDERHGKGEGQVGVGREAAQVGRRLEPAGVDGEQQHREHQRRDHHRGLAQGAHHRPARKRADLDQDLAVHAAAGSGAGSGSSSSAAPSSE